MYPDLRFGEGGFRSLEEHNIGEIVGASLYQNDMGDILFPPRVLLPMLRWPRMSLSCIGIRLWSERHELADNPTFRRLGSWTGKGGGTIDAFMKSGLGFYISGHGFIVYTRLEMYGFPKPKT